MLSLDITNFKWDKVDIGANIELFENDMKILLKESAYMFRTAIGDQVFFLIFSFIQRNFLFIWF